MLEINREAIKKIINLPNEKERLEKITEMKKIASENKLLAEFNKMYKLEEKLKNKYNMENKFEFKITYDSNGKPEKTIENFINILKNDKQFQGKIKYNEMKEDIEFKGESLSDRKMSKILNEIEIKYDGLYDENKLIHSLNCVGLENSYNPIKNTIESVKWDQKERIKCALIDWLGAEPTEYNMEVSRLIFAGGIHRIYEPGSKFDIVPTLIGSQGCGKSTFVRWLAMNDENFTEVTEIEGQKGMEILDNVWVAELSELLALKKVKEVEAIKSYLSKLFDKYRPAYARFIINRKRKCIFIATTNKEEFLTDKTGNRRFFPVKVNSSAKDLYENEKEIKEYIKQCWAEALFKYKEGKLPNVEENKLKDEIKQKQKDSMEDDYREGLILSYLENKMSTCVLDLWQNALQNYTKPTKRDSNEIGDIMNNIYTWEKKGNKRFADFGIQKCWEKRSGKK